MPWVVVPHPEPRSVNRQTRPNLHFAQRFLCAQPAAPLLHLAQCPLDSFRKETEVLLEDIVHGAGAHHVYSMLLTKDAGEEDERRIGSDLPGILQGQAAGITGKNEVGQNQIEASTLQGFGNTCLVENHFAIEAVAASFERDEREFSVVRAVFNKQDADRCCRRHNHPVADTALLERSSALEPKA